MIRTNFQEIKKKTKLSNKLIAYFKMGRKHWRDLPCKVLTLVQSSLLFIIPQTPAGVMIPEHKVRSRFGLLSHVAP